MAFQEESEPRTGEHGESRERRHFGCFGGERYFVSLRICQRVSVAKSFVPGSKAQVTCKVSEKSPVKGISPDAQWIDSIPESPVSAGPGAPAMELAPFRSGVQVNAPWQKNPRFCADFRLFALFVASWSGFKPHVPNFLSGPQCSERKPFALKGPPHSNTWPNQGHSERQAVDKIRRNPPVSWHAGHRLSFHGDGLQALRRRPGLVIRHV